MGEHARVSRMVDPAPWLAESALIKNLMLPLNLDQNTHSDCHGALTRAREYQRRGARSLPVLPLRMTGGKRERPPGV